MQPHDIVRRLGGVAWRRELIEAGSWDDIIDMSVSFGRLRRVRRGLYVLPDISEAAVIALRVGGRLACISSLAHHGMRVAEAGALADALATIPSRRAAPAEISAQRMLS